MNPMITDHKSLITIFLRSRSTLFLVALASVVLLPKAQAVSPPPDGGYPRGNTAEGQNSLFSLTSGGYNTAVGYFSLRSDATGSFNTAIGAGALLANTGDELTATGVAALLSNTTGCCDTANGAFALFSNTTGSSNEAFGFHALLSNTTGSWNNAFGGAALNGNTTGDSNCAFGDAALLFNTAGFRNVAIGRNALHDNNGNNNTAIGHDAGQNITGNSNICIGADVAGVADENYTIRIGDNLPNFQEFSACYIGGIWGQLPGVDSRPMYIGSDGKIGTAPPSSRRFKRDIKPMDRASQAILSLKPVSFHYKNDAKKTPQFGLIAEEVAEVNPDLVVRDGRGGIYSVRYEAVNAMLLNEFLKEHRKVEEQQASIVYLKSTMGQQQKEFETTAAKQQREIQS